MADDGGRMPPDHAEAYFVGSVISLSAFALLTVGALVAWMAGVAAAGVFASLLLVLDAILLVVAVRASRHPDRLVAPSEEHPALVGMVLVEGVDAVVTPGWIAGAAAVSTEGVRGDAALVLDVVRRLLLDGLATPGVVTAEGSARRLSPGETVERLSDSTYPWRDERSRPHETIRMPLTPAGRAKGAELRGDEPPPAALRLDVREGGVRERTRAWASIARRLAERVDAAGAKPDPGSPGIVVLVHIPGEVFPGGAEEVRAGIRMRSTDRLVVHVRVPDRMPGADSLTELGAWVRRGLDLAEADLLEDGQPAGCVTSARAVWREAVERDAG